MSFLISLTSLLPPLLFMSISVGVNSSCTNLSAMCQKILAPQTWKLSLHGNPFVGATMPGMLTGNLHPLQQFLLIHLPLMKIILPALSTCQNGNSSLNSTLGTTYNLMILTCLVIATLTPITIGATRIYLYTFKTWPFHFLT